MTAYKYIWVTIILIVQTCLAVYAISSDTLPLASAIIISATYFFILLTVIDIRTRRMERAEQFDKQYIPYITILYVYCFIIQLAITIFGENIRLWDDFLLLVYGLFLILLGNLMPRIPYRSLMGLWLPWIFRSESVWRLSHRLGGQLMFLTGFCFIVISALNFNIKHLATLFTIYVVLPTVIISLICSIYARSLYRTEIKDTGDQ